MRIVLGMFAVAFAAAAAGAAITTSKQINANQAIAASSQAT